MMRATIVLLVLFGAATISIQPARHDFGKWGVRDGTLETDRSMTFRVSMPAGVGAGDTLLVSLVGNDGDFRLVEDRTPPPDRCDSDRPWPTATTVRGVCNVDVVFEPQSPGIKVATLFMLDSRGNRGMADLTGEGVGALCEMKVVPCNYAYLYSGRFSWKIDLQDADTKTQTNVIVNVVKGAAVCSGTFVETDASAEPLHGTISGSGLIGVEFLEDPMYPLAYRIIASCPSTLLPDVPSQPATLGNSNTMESDRQPASAVGVEQLTGTINYPAPESDPVNGVTGTVQVSWALGRKCVPGTPFCP